MELNREKLFDEVWTTPITHLCKSYGLSDQGLRKACVKLQIPLPQRGHWARIAAGHAVAKPVLKPLRPQDSETKRSKPRGVVAAAVNAGGSLLDAVPPSLPLTGILHPALVALATIYEQADVEGRQLQEKFIWESEHPGKRYAGKAPTFGGWQYFCDAGQVLRPTHKKSMLRVSIGTYKRAFELLQGLITRLERVGYEVSVPAGHERLQAKRGQAVVVIKVAEKLEAGHRTEYNSWSKEPRLVRTLRPTGRLTLGVEQMGLGETLISDRTDDRIESRWDQVMSAIEYRHAQSLARVAEWARSKREYEDREQERQEALRRQEEARRAAEAEQAKRQDLLKEAGNWHQAQMLRAYLGHLEDRRIAGGVPSDDYASWIAWASAVALTLDKSEARVKSIALDA